MWKWHSTCKQIRANSNSLITNFISRHGTTLNDYYCNKLLHKRGIEGGLLLLLPVFFNDLSISGTLEAIIDIELKGFYKKVHILCTFLISHIKYINVALHITQQNDSIIISYYHIKFITYQIVKWSILSLALSERDSCIS